MPISPAHAESNRQQTERLKSLVRRLDPDMFSVRLPKGWTVAVSLAHVAFWDRQRLCLMRRWEAGDESEGRYGGDLFNEVLLPFLEQIPGEWAAAAAVRSAEEVDAYLERVPDDVLAAALARPGAPNIDRGSHRKHHLDRIERALAEAGFTGFTG